MSCKKLYRPALDDGTGHTENIVKASGGMVAVHPCGYATAARLGYLYGSTKSPADTCTAKWQPALAAEVRRLQSISWACQRILLNALS